MRLGLSYPSLSSNGGAPKDEPRSPPLGELSVTRGQRSRSELPEVGSGGSGIASEWETARTRGRWLPCSLSLWCQQGQWLERGCHGELWGRGALHSCGLWVGCVLKLLGIGKQILQADGGGDDVGCCGAKTGFFVVPFVSGPRGVPAR